MKFLKVERPAGICVKRSLTDEFKDILLYTDLLRMGWSSYQNVVPPPLSKNFRVQMVHARYSDCCNVGDDLVYICNIDRYFRVSAHRILLAASIAAALRRLTKVLLGKRHIEPSARCDNPVSTYTYDMETTNVDEKQNLSDMCLCAWCLVSL